MLDRPYYIVRREASYKAVYQIMHSADDCVGEVNSATLAYHIIELLNEEHRRETLERQLHQSGLGLRRDRPTP